jgi:signal transduction histidine kinase
MSAEVGSIDAPQPMTLQTLSEVPVRPSLRVPAGRRLAPWLLLPALLTATWWTLNSSHFAQPEVRAAYLAYLIAAPVLIGLYWWIRRPSNGLGRLLVIYGFAAWPLSLQASDEPLFFTIGVASETVLAFLTFYVCLAFPRGRLTSTFDRRLMAGWALTLAVFWAPWLFAVPRLQGGGPLSTCVVQCPANVLQFETIADSTLLLIAPVGIALSVVFAAIIIGVNVSRLAVASPPRKRAQWPVTVVTLLFLTAFSAYHLSRGLIPVEPAATSAIEAVFVAAQILFPLGFLASLLRADLFAASASRRLVEGLAGVASPNSLRESLSAALGDPDLRLGVWDEDRRIFIQADGQMLPHVRPERGELWVPVMSDNRNIAGIVADESLSSETALLAAASAATVVAINEENAAEDAMALRAKVVNATDAERQQIARDLHDSAQQRLVALRVKVSLAADLMGDLPENQAVMNRLGGELDEAIEDLRNVSRRFLAPYLVRGGIAPAIRSITRTWPIEVDVDDTGLGRHSPEVELCVYNCCLEALQNAFEYAGDNTTVTVRLTDIEGAVTFSVSDDGVGFDPLTTQPGAGLLGMADRALLAGGSLTVTAAPGLGVVVRGAIPDPALGTSSASPGH